VIRRGTVDQQHDVRGRDRLTDDEALAQPLHVLELVAEVGELAHRGGYAEAWLLLAELGYELVNLPAEFDNHCLSLTALLIVLVRLCLPALGLQCGNLSLGACDLLIDLCRIHTNASVGASPMLPPPGRARIGALDSPTRRRYARPMPSMIGPYDPPFDPWNRPPTWLVPLAALNHRPTTMLVICKAASTSGAGLSAS